MTGWGNRTGSADMKRQRLRLHNAVEAQAALLAAYEREVAMLHHVQASPSAFHEAAVAHVKHCRAALTKARTA